MRSSRTHCSHTGTLRKRALGIRVRGLYSTKDTFVSTALQVGVKIAWLESQTGVNYITLRRHYGSGCRRRERATCSGSSASIPACFRYQVCPFCLRTGYTDFQDTENCGGIEMRKGGLEPATFRKNVEEIAWLTAKERHRTP